jgi:hypothetical protein
MIVGATSPTSADLMPLHGLFSDTHMAREIGMESVSGFNLLLGYVANSL